MMKCKIILFIFLLIPLVFADTTFFDNSDDVFVMGGSSSTPTTDSGITGGTTGTNGDGSCLYKWNCTDWGECLSSGKQIRECINIGTCSDKYKTPEIEKNCTNISFSPKAEKGDKNLEKQEEINWKKVVDKNKIFFYAVVILITLSVVFYLKKNYYHKTFAFTAH